VGASIIYTPPPPRKRRSPRRFVTFYTKIGMIYQIARVSKRLIHTAPSGEEYITGPWVLSKDPHSKKYVAYHQDDTPAPPHPPGHRGCVQCSVGDVADRERTHIFFEALAQAVERDKAESEPNATS
jgi:hypothetical protein